MNNAMEHAFKIPPGMIINMRFYKVYYPMRKGIIKIEVSGWKQIGTTC